MALLKDIDWLRPSVLALVAANLVPLAGVLAFGWEVFPLVLLFWMENIIVGVFNVLKMLFAAPGQHITWVGKLFLIPFFSFHYGMFTFVHGVFVIGLFGGGFRQGAPFPNGHLVWDIMKEYHLGWAVLGLAISHGVSFVHNYLISGEYRNASVTALMAQPYGRIVVLHMTILIGAFLIMALKSPTAGLVLLVILKIGLDLRGHLRERKKFEKPEEPFMRPDVGSAEPAESRPDAW